MAISLFYFSFYSSKDFFYKKTRESYTKPTKNMILSETKPADTVTSLEKNPKLDCL